MLDRRSLLSRIIGGAGAVAAVALSTEQVKAEATPYPQRHGEVLLYPQSMYCSRCGAILFHPVDKPNIYEHPESHGGIACKNSGKFFEVMPQKVSLREI